MTAPPPTAVVGPGHTLVLAPVLALLLEDAKALKTGELPMGTAKDANLYEVTFKALVPAVELASVLQLTRQHMVLAVIQGTVDEQGRDRGL